MPHLKIFCLGRPKGLAVETGLVETADLLLAGCKHIAGITYSFSRVLSCLAEVIQCIQSTRARVVVFFQTS